MNNKKISILLLIVALLLSLVLSACSTECTVTFETNGGSSIDSQTIAIGTSPTQPSDPTKEGYTFAGWVDSSGATYNFDKSIASNVTIYAVWLQIVEDDTVYYTVDFDSNGGSQVDSQQVEAGLTATTPTTPTRTGYVFDYWSDEDGRTYSFDSVISADTTVYAQWIAEQYTVTFVYDYDDIVTEQTISYGDTVVEPNNATQSGHTFVSWVDDNGDVFDFDTVITQDTTITATWAEREPDVTYTVTFDSNGGSAVPAQTIVEDNTASLPTPAPTYTGYVFACWQDDNGDEFDFDNTAITDNIVLTAQWSLAEYVVTFETYGGSQVDSITVQSGSSISQPDDPTMEGYIFDGWFDRDNNLFDFDNTASISNITLYAEWTAIEYTVTFVDGFGEILYTFVVSYGGSVVEPIAPSYAGYDFDGWMDDNGDGFDFDKIITLDTTIIASWTPSEVQVDSYTVSFDSDGGSAVPAQTIVEDNTASLPTPVPTYTGYVFVCWQDDNGDEFDFDNTAITDNIVLTAVWDIEQYTVSFVTSTSVTVLDQTIDYGSSATQPSALVRTGYTFGGWTLNDRAYSFDSAVVSDIELVAVWNVISYTVTFEDGSGNFISEQSVEYDNVASQPNTPTMSDMTFVSWTISNGSVFDFATTIKEDITLYATWQVTKQEYKVSFDSMGGTSIVSQFIVEGEYASMPTPDPTKAGYTFAYWADSTTTIQFNFDSTAITSNISLVAIWSLSKYTVTFESTGGSTVDSQTVAYNGLAVCPAISPVRSGYMFVCWTDKDGNEIDFSSTYITSDTTIYALWKSVSYDDVSDYHEGKELTTLTIYVDGVLVTWTADLTDNATTVFIAGTNVYTGYYTVNGVDTYLELSLTASECVAQDSYVVIKNATCDEMGIEVLYCSICGAILDTRSIPMLEHDYSILVYTEGDCCNYGYTEYMCSLCGSYKMDDDNPEETYKTYDDYYGEHSWITNEDGTYLVTEVTPATCCTEGVGYLTCSVCGATEKVSIPTIPHDYSVEVVYIEGTCQTRAVMAWTCAYCGAYLLDEDGNVETHEGDYGEHNYVDGQCTICGAWAEPEYMYDIGEIAGTVFFNVYLDSTNPSYYVCTITGSGAVKSQWYNSVSIATGYIQSLIIFDGITSLPEGFMNKASSFNGLTTVEFQGDSITEIPEYCFANCTALIKVTYPSSLVEVCDYAFYQCYSLEWTAMSDTLEAVGYKSYYDTCIDYVDLSNTVVATIGDFAYYTSSTKYIILPGTITTKSGNSFYQDSVYNIFGDIPIIILGEYNANLTYNYRSTEYFLGEGSSIDNITVWDNESVTFSSYDSFIVRINQNCAVTTDNSSNYYTDVFGSGGSVVIYCPTTITNSEAQWLLDLGEQSDYPDVVMISGEAFYDCRNLTNITIPDSVEVIGHGAFVQIWSGSALTVMTIGENSMLHDIGDYAFYGCNFTELRLPSQLATIGYMSLYIVPLTTMYYDCIMLTYMPTYEYNPDSTDPYDTTGRTLFDSTTSLINYINTTSLDIIFGSTVEIITDYIFFLRYNGTNYDYYKDECTVIKSLDFTNATSLHTIWYSAFMGNNAVTELDLSNTQLTYWAEGGSYTFGYMEGLTTVYMPAVDGLVYGNTTNVSMFACIFQGCTSLSEIYLTGNITAEWVDNVGIGLFSGIGSASNPVTVYIDASVTSLPQYLFCGLSTNYINFVIATGSELEIGEDGNVYYGDTVVINTNGGAVMTVTFE